MGRHVGLNRHKEEMCYDYSVYNQIICIYWRSPKNRQLAKMWQL